MRKTLSMIEKGTGKMARPKLKFVIVSPAQKYGGAIALHALCKYLCDLGYDAQIFFADHMTYKKKKKLHFWIHYVVDNFVHYFKIAKVGLFGEERFRNNPKYIGYVDLPVKDCKRKIIPWVTKDTIVVYPDIAYGNFLHASKVVRWLLYYNRYSTDMKAYNENDMFVCYREIFNDSELNPKGRALQVGYFDLNFYKRINFGKREGNCYVIRKGRQRSDLPKVFNGTIIDDLSELEKVTVLNKCEYCISYDLQTSYTAIAALCGCISVMIPENGKNWDDYRTAEELRDGVALGFSEEEINRATSTAYKLKNQFQRSNEKSKSDVMKFVGWCENYFDSEKERYKE